MGIRQTDRKPLSIQVFNGDVQSPNCPEIDVIWTLYHKRVRGLADEILKRNSLRISDAEDIAQCVFHGFVQSAMKGRYGLNMLDQSIWFLLAAMTHGIVIDHFRYENRQCRANSRVESVVDELKLPSKSKTPDEQLIEKERVGQLLTRLESLPLQEIAYSRMLGYNNAEIARIRNCSVRTVERCIVKIKQRLLDAPSEN